MTIRLPPYPLSLHWNIASRAHQCANNTKYPDIKMVIYSPLPVRDPSALTPRTVGCTAMQDTAPNRGRVLVSPLLPGREVENVLMQLFSPQYSLSPSALNARVEGDTSKAWGFKFKSKFFYSHNTHKKPMYGEK